MSDIGDQLRSEHAEGYAGTCGICHLVADLGEARDLAEARRLANEAINHEREQYRDRLDQTVYAARLAVGSANEKLRAAEARAASAERTLAALQAGIR